VVPELARLFHSAGQPLPLQTRLLIGLSSFVRSYGWLLLGGAGLGFMPSATPWPAGRLSGSGSTARCCACRFSATCARSSSSPASPASSP
jgi:hypothetical protein